MKYLKVEAVIKIDEDLFSLNDKDEIKWFTDIMKDKENTFLQIWSNEFGDEICSTYDFKWNLLTEFK
jgi:hypothetical protein